MPTLCCSAREVTDLAAAVTAQGRSLRLVVRGGSMAPALHSGDRVTVAPTDPARLTPGDIVMIDGTQPRIHRVARVDPDAGMVVTRGDSLAGDDPPSPFADVVGQVVGTERSWRGRARRLLGRLRPPLP